MRHFAFCRADGVVQFTSRLSDDIEPAVPEGFTVVETASELPAGPHRLVDGVPTVYVVEVTLAEAKAQRKAEIDAEMAQRKSLPIEFAGSMFDADRTARENVSGWQTQLAAGTALPDGFVWRDAANVDHPADAAFVNGLGAAITLRGTILYGTAWALKAAVDAAESNAAAQAVQWP